jgi:hypothetical protein
MRAVYLVCLAAVGFILSPAAHGGWFSYDSYEDCMLGRMKGQNSMMYAAADKACKKQFGVEFDVYRSGVKWEYHTSGIDRHEILITEAPDEYEITSAEVSFSAKSCEGLTAADFGKPVILRFVSGKARLPFDMKDMQCAQLLSVKGKYK